MISRPLFILQIQCLSSFEFHFAFIRLRFILTNRNGSSMNLYFSIRQLLVKMLCLFSFSFCIFSDLLRLKVQLLLPVIRALIIFSNVFHVFFGHYLKVSQHCLEDLLLSNHKQRNGFLLFIKRILRPNQKVPELKYILSYKRHTPFK